MSFGVWDGSFVSFELWDGVKNYIINMPRKARIDYPGLTLHVMAHTFDKMLLFRDNCDKKQYLSYLSKRIHETGCICFAWALMNNHLHLLIKTSENPLWSLMRPLQSEYSRYYNKKYQRKGPLFHDRYKSIATQDQLYLEQLVCYIHLNPIRAGICKTLKSLRRYRWSGHACLMGVYPNDFQDSKTVQKRFGKTPSSARAAYEQMLRKQLHTPVEDDLTGNVRRSNKGTKSKTSPEIWVIGDAKFQKSVIKKDIDQKLTIARFKREGIDLHGLLVRVASKMNVPEELIVFASKRTAQAEARKVFCYFAGMLQFPTRQTAAFLGIQQAAVTNAARQGRIIVQQSSLTII
ncbi:MAG: hypothetical protein GF398_14870 [Chitinivibrionales bacterium]|nr:hypothetical protein [Chitinivibrionales bacterium]